MLSEDTYMISYSRLHRADQVDPNQIYQSLSVHSHAFRTLMFEMIHKTVLLSFNVDSRDQTYARNDQGDFESDSRFVQMSCLGYMSVVLWLLECRSVIVIYKKHA